MTGTQTASRPGVIGAALRNVTFNYPGAARPALVGLSLDIPPESLVAVTGPVGSGKSALARAMLGIYPIQSGTMRLLATDGSNTTLRPGLLGYFLRAHICSRSRSARTF